MSESQQARETRPWVSTLLQLGALVLVVFGVIAAMTGEWGVAVTDFGLLAIGIWIAKTPNG
jgi:hypothetical protein